jgi:hypothetical protein
MFRVAAVHPLGGAVWVPRRRHGSTWRIARDMNFRRFAVGAIRSPSTDETAMPPSSVMVATGPSATPRSAGRYGRLPVNLTVSFLVLLPTEVRVTRRVICEPTAAADLTVTLALMRYVADGARDGV